MKGNCKNIEKNRTILQKSVSGGVSCCIVLKRQESEVAETNMSSQALDEALQERALLSFQRSCIFLPEFLSLCPSLNGTGTMCASDQM